MEASGPGALHRLRPFFSFTASPRHSRILKILREPQTHNPLRAGVAPRAPPGDSRGIVQGDSRGVWIWQVYTHTPAVGPRVGFTLALVQHSTSPGPGPARTSTRTRPSARPAQTQAPAPGPGWCWCVLPYRYGTWYGVRIGYGYRTVLHYRYRTVYGI